MKKLVMRLLLVVLGLGVLGFAAFGLLVTVALNRGEAALFFPPEGSVRLQCFELGPEPQQQPSPSVKPVGWRL